MTTIYSAKSTDAGVTSLQRTYNHQSMTDHSASVESYQGIGVDEFIDYVFNNTNTTTSSNEYDPLVANLAKRRASLVVNAKGDADLNAVLSFKFQPEFIRFIAYIGFLTMLILAIIITNTVVAPALLAGPEPGEPFCPPFENGVGFDIATDSHLVRHLDYNNVSLCSMFKSGSTGDDIIIFGFRFFSQIIIFLKFSQICFILDYSPSREIAAAYYPFFEYSLLLYICADFISVAIHWKKGLVSKRYYFVFLFCFPFMIIFSSWFRLIFVITSYENFAGHTFGFLMLQLVLIAVACLNVWFIVEAGIEYKFLGGPKTKYFAFVYLFLNLVISAIEIYVTAYVVLTGSNPSWAATPISGHDGGMVPGQLISYIWMIFNVLIPFVLSYVRSRSERPLEVTVDFKLPCFIQEEQIEETVSSAPGADTSDKGGIDNNEEA